MYVQRAIFNYIFCTQLFIYGRLVLIELEIQLQVESTDFLEGIDERISRKDHIQFPKPDILRFVRSHSLLQRKEFSPSHTPMWCTVPNICIYREVMILLWQTRILQALTLIVCLCSCVTKYQYEAESKLMGKSRSWMYFLTILTDSNTYSLQSGK